jgi:hypothetical protein
MEWRQANVTPAYKKGDKSSIYRPISDTCIDCKIMEHIITSHIMKHADKNNILYSKQHGFRSKLSCETQLIEFIEDVANNMNQRKQTDVLIMDFSKHSIRWAINDQSTNSTNMVYEAKSKTGYRPS